MTELLSTRDGFGQALLTAGALNKNLVVLTADLADSTRCKDFKKNFPERFFELGVAEQNLIGVAAGLALSGKTAVVSSYAAFSPGRSWDQLRVSVCYQKANVKIAGHHTGLSIGPDGATHQGLEDISLTRCLPNLAILTPADFKQAKLATLAAINHNGPVYLRLTKTATEPISRSPEFNIGQAERLAIGTDVTLIGCGPILSQALKAAKELKKQKISLEIINLTTIKPLDINTILKSVKKTHCLVTLEDHQVMGGMGSAVIESLVKTYAAPVTEMLGVQDKFGQSGTTEQLWHHYNLDSIAIQSAVKKVLSRKNRL